MALASGRVIPFFSVHIYCNLGRVENKSKKDKSLSQHLGVLALHCFGLMFVFVLLLFALLLCMPVPCYWGRDEPSRLFS